jgi:hypothetical protein
MLIWSPVRIIYEQVHDTKKIQMAWACWPDFTFCYQIRLVGWLAEIGKVPGPRFNYKVDIKPKVLANLVSARINAMLEENGKALCCIEPWTKGM